MFQVQLVTRSGRRFLLASFGWTFWDQFYEGKRLVNVLAEDRALTFETKTEAYQAMLKAWKARGDKTSIMEVKQ